MKTIIAVFVTLASACICASIFAVEIRLQNFDPAAGFDLETREDGLAKAETADHRIDWIDALGKSQSAPVIRETAKGYQSRYRSMALSSSTGSLVISPFPHQYLYPLDFADNFGYNWAGDEYLDMIDGFAWGVRQPPIGDRRFVPWVKLNQAQNKNSASCCLFRNSQATRTWKW